MTVLCAECESLPPDPDQNAPYPRLSKIAGEVLSWPGVQLDCDVKHWVDAGRVLLRYKLKPFIACSLPGRHAHGEGCIAKTRCGIVLRLGHICAEGSVVGWDKVREQMREAIIDGEIADAQRKAFAMIDRFESLEKRFRPTLLAFYEANDIEPGARRIEFVSSNFTDVRRAGEIRELTDRALNLSRLSRPKRESFARDVTLASERLDKFETVLDSLVYRTKAPAQKIATLEKTRSGYVTGVAANTEASMAFREESRRR
jgi:hypothetical protein